MQLVNYYYTLNLSCVIAIHLLLSKFEVSKQQQHHTCCLAELFLSQFRINENDNKRERRRKKKKEEEEKVLCHSLEEEYNICHSIPPWKEVTSETNLL